MVSKFTFGKPFKTEAVIKNFPLSNTIPDCIELGEDKKSFTASLGYDDVIYGLGESVRGINKRGFKYISNCSDDFSHTEDKSSLYGAHNFFIVDGEEKYGIFVDFPGKVYFDMGYTDLNKINVSVEDNNFELYVIEADSVAQIIKEFREMIGQSYIAPYWAFGYQQSRWSYNTADDVRAIVKGDRKSVV